MSLTPPPLEVNQLDQDIRSMMQALPTRTDIEALILRLEETHRRDIQEVREDVTNLTDRVASGEAAFSDLTSRVAALEQTHDTHRDMSVALQLHVEDQSHRNNLQLRGLPEASGAEDLSAMAVEIFHRVLESPSEVLVMDRIHRALNP